MYMALRHYGAILERQLDLKRERIAESARTLVFHLPLKCRGRQDHIPIAEAADHGGQSRRGTARGGSSER